MPDRQNTVMDRESRDLLIRLDTKVESIGIDVKELKDNTATRLSKVEQDKLDRTESVKVQNDNLRMWTELDTKVDKIDKSVTVIQTWGSAGVLALGLVQFGLNFFF